MKRTFLIFLAAVVLAGCGSSSYGGSGSKSSAASATPPAAPTLYTFARDSAGRSNCSGACAKNWPPAAPTLKPPAGIKRSSLGTVKRSDGSLQLAYAGRPLYRFVGDTKPGDAKGDGVNAFGGVWRTVSRSPQQPPQAQTQPSSPSYGY